MTDVVGMASLSPLPGRIDDIRRVERRCKHPAVGLHIASQGSQAARDEALSVNRFTCNRSGMYTCASSKLIPVI